MKIQIALPNRSGYWFCGSIALTPVNSINTTKEVDLEAITRQEIIGLHKAVRTKAVVIVGDGIDVLNNKAESLKVKKGFEQKTKEVIVEKPVEVVEEVVKDLAEEVPTEDVPKVEIEEVAEEAPKVRRTTTRSVKK